MKFSDGGSYTITDPTMSIEGILLNSYKTQVFYNECKITDTENNIVANIKYNPNFDNSYQGMVGRYTIGWLYNGLGKN